MWKRARTLLLVGTLPVALVVVVFVVAVRAADHAAERVRSGNAAASQPPSVAAPEESATPISPAAAPPIAAPAPAMPAATARPINVTPEQLRKDYDANEVSADEIYRGRTLFVTGLVRAVRKDALDEPYVELSTSNDFMSVHARFRPGSDAVLGKFQRGDRIVVRCLGNNTVIGSPQLKDCVLEHHYRRVPTGQ